MNTDISAVASVAASRGGEGHRAAVSAFVSPAAAPAAAAAAPTPPADTAEALQAPSAEDLQEVISQIERYLESSRTGLEFRVDRDLDQVIVSVVDPRDGTVLRQMPSEEALRIARAMADEGDGGLLDALA